LLTLALAYIGDAIPMLKYYNNAVLGIPAEPVYGYPAVCDPPRYDDAVFGVSPPFEEKKTK